MPAGHALPADSSPQRPITTHGGTTISSTADTTAQPGPPTRKQRNIWVTIGSTAGLKVLVMGVGGVLGMINTKLILSHFGKPAYAQYGLLASLPSLLPFASLGMAAVVMNAVSQAKDPRDDREMARTLTTALRARRPSAVHQGHAEYPALVHRLFAGRHLPLLQVVEHVPTCRGGGGVSRG